MSATIQYRLTPAVDALLGERADEWGVSRHEAARRLAVLANYQLSTDDHDRVAGIAASAGCSFVAAAVVLSDMESDDG